MKIIVNCKIKNTKTNASNAKLKSITALWLVLIVPTQGGMARLSWPG